MRSYDLSELDAFMADVKPATRRTRQTKAETAPTPKPRVRSHPGFARLAGTTADDTAFVVHYRTAGCFTTHRLTVRAKHLAEARASLRFRLAPSVRVLSVREAA